MSSTAHFVILPLMHWPHPIYAFTVQELQRYSDEDIEWQVFCLGIRDMDTGRKLSVLDAYRYNRLQDGGLDRKSQVQIDSYIYGLKRYNFLNAALEVVK